MNRLLFVTGTDTGVGKTLLTALLLRHLRASGVWALAMKPFCSGGTADVDLIQAVQDGEIASHEVNPFYFDEPVAPLVALRRSGRDIRLSEALDAIKRVARRAECVLIEGSGGLLVPLGEEFTVADIIAALRCSVVIVARNKLGTINHTLLTVEALRARGLKRIAVTLMEQQDPDASARDNVQLIAERTRCEVFVVPFLGPNAARLGAVKRNAKKIKITLASLCAFASFTPRCSSPAKVVGA